MPFEAPPRTPPSVAPSTPSRHSSSRHAGTHTPSMKHTSTPLRTPLSSPAPSVASKRPDVPSRRTRTGTPSAARSPASTARAGPSEVPWPWKARVEDVLSSASSPSLSAVSDLAGVPETPVTPVAMKLKTTRSSRRQPTSTAEAPPVTGFPSPGAPVRHLQGIEQPNDTLNSFGQWTELYLMLHGWSLPSRLYILDHYMSSNTEREFVSDLVQKGALEGDMIFFYRLADAELRGHLKR